MSTIDESAARYEPFRIGSRWGTAVHLAPGEHRNPIDQLERENWLRAAGLLAEGHCPGWPRLPMDGSCSRRLIQIGKWAHCRNCNTCWQLGRDEHGQPTISWTTSCMHWFRIDDQAEAHYVGEVPDPAKGGLQVSDEFHQHRMEDVRDLLRRFGAPFDSQPSGES